VTEANTKGAFFKIDLFRSTNRSRQKKINVATWKLQGRRPKERQLRLSIPIENDATWPFVVGQLRELRGHLIRNRGRKIGQHQHMAKVVRDRTTACRVKGGSSQHNNGRDASLKIHNKRVDGINSGERARRFGGEKITGTLRGGSKRKKGMPNVGVRKGNRSSKRKRKGARRMKNKRSLIGGKMVHGGPTGVQKYSVKQQGGPKQEPEEIRAAVPKRTLKVRKAEIRAGDIGS